MFSGFLLTPPQTQDQDFCLECFDRPPEEQKRPRYFFRILLKHFEKRIRNFVFSVFIVPPPRRTSRILCSGFLLAPPQTQDQEFCFECSPEKMASGHFSSCFAEPFQKTGSGLLFSVRLPTPSEKTVSRILF